MIHADNLSRPALRRLLRQKRRALSATGQQLASRHLTQQLQAHPLLRRARRVAAYLASDGEISPAALLETLKKRHRAIYLPVLKRWPRTRMVFQRVKPDERLYPNRFGIPEPRPRASRQPPVWTLDLLLLPLVGFDPQGGRLGMGGGFYDRLLAYRLQRQYLTGPRLLGLAHDCQKVDLLPLEAWDIRLDATVTDAGWYPARLTR